ncbi:hypothetical protein KY285_008002 [Solanum tuberosum]|nr:hypothetical protein KY285_008002 [Solanum tuberosum]
MDNLRSRCRVFLADAIEASAGLDIALLRRLALWFSKLPRWQVSNMQRYLQFLEL